MSSTMATPSSPIMFSFLMMSSRWPSGITGLCPSIASRILCMSSRFFCADLTTIVAQYCCRTDRWLASGVRGGGGAGEGGGLAWVRCRFEFYLPAPPISFAFVRFLAMFLFPSFPELYHTSPYSDFRLYLSDLHKCPWFA
jgi:hypothetical protein